MSETPVITVPIIKKQASPLRKEKLTRVCLMLNKRTIDKIAKVQRDKNFNTRTAAVVEIINAFR